MSKTTKVSAMAKFILCGEHFVVTGPSSVVIPASCFRTNVALTECDGVSPNSPCSIEASCAFDIEQPLSHDGIRHLELTVVDLAETAMMWLGIDSRGKNLRLEVKSTIPPSQGAGSSSAICRAVIDVFVKHFLLGERTTPEYALFLGKMLETHLHGDVSGIDNAAVAYETPLCYQKGFKPEPFQFSQPTFFVVGSTGKRTGKSPYDVFRDYKTHQPLVYKANCDTIDEFSPILAENLRIGDFIESGRIMNETHEILQTIGLSTPKCEAAIDSALKIGAFGAKMTGAGCGGFVIALTPLSLVEKIQRAWIERGLTNVRCLQFLGANG